MKIPIIRMKKIDWRNNARHRWSSWHEIRGHKTCRCSKQMIQRYATKCSRYQVRATHRKIYTKTYVLRTPPLQVIYSNKSLWQNYSKTLWSVPRSLSSRKRHRTWFLLSHEGHVPRLLRTRPFYLNHLMFFSYELYSTDITDTSCLDWCWLYTCLPRLFA